MGKQVDGSGNVRLERLVRRVTCWAFGHQYRVVQVFRPGLRRVKCDRCGGDWGMNDDVQALVDWDRELEDLERFLGREVKEPRFSA